MTSPYVIPNDSATGAFVAPQGDIGRALAQLGAGVGGFGEGLGSITNPYGDFHEKIREMLASNPEALGNLADFAHENPTAFGTLSKMFPRDVLGAITQVRPSERSAARTRAQKNAPLLDISTSQLAGMDLTPSQLETIRGAAGAVPGALAQTATAGLEAVGEGSAYQGLTAEEKTQADRYMIPYFRHLKDMEDQEALRLRMLRANDRQSANDWAERYRAMTVEEMMRRFPGTGTPDLWRSFISDPKIQQRARDLANGTIQPTNESDQQLAQMGQSVMLRPNAAIDRQRLAHQRSITTLMDRITNGYHVPGSETGSIQRDSPEVISSVKLPMLQRELDILSSPMFGGPKLKAEYVPPPPKDIWHPGTIFHRGYKLRITDEIGNEVDSEFLNQLPTNPGAANPDAVNALLSSNPKAQEAWQIMVQRGNISADLARLRQDDVRTKTKLNNDLRNGLWWQIVQAINMASPQSNVTETP